jgi:hypothetical protein
VLFIGFEGSRREKIIINSTCSRGTKVHHRHEIEYRLTPPELYYSSMAGSTGKKTFSCAIYWLSIKAAENLLKNILLYLAIIVPTPSLVNSSNNNDPPTVPSMICTLWTPP